MSFPGLDLTTQNAHTILAAANTAITVARIHRLCLSDGWAVAIWCFVDGMVSDALEICMDNARPPAPIQERRRSTRALEFSG